MALVSTKNSVKLVITAKTGVNEKGEDIKKTMNLSKVKATASDDSLYATAKAIEPLLKYPVIAIGKDDSYTMIEQA